MPGTRPGMTPFVVLRVELRLTGDRFSERSLPRRKPRDRHAIGRARDIVEPDLVAERHRRRIAAMFAADPNLEAGARLAPARNADLHEFTNALAIERNEGIDLEDALGDIGPEEARGVVAADAVGRLRQIVGAEGEELRGLGDLAGHQAGARQLDH